MANLRNNALPDPFLVGIDAALSHHLPVVASSQRLVVGLSGGRDSVALLHALAALRRARGYHLAACHVHHGISENAERWLEFCCQLCDRLTIPLRIARVNVSRTAPEGLEAAARACRYRVFSEIEADWLILAQHRDDQAETLLFNLLRSGGIHGARAMPEVRVLRPGLHLLRPLLRVSRTEIEAYLERNELQWVDDESNSDIRLSRNYLRHCVMPLLRQRFPSVDERFSLATERFSEAAGLLDDLACLDLCEASARFPFPLARLRGLSEPRARNLLRFLLAQQGVMIPSEVRLREALRQMLEAKQDRHPSVILGGWRLFRKGAEICLEKTLGAGIKLK
jgi:tRNA(Ile)-lysidine synthase